jgi:hypothetical protein
MEKTSSSVEKASVIRTPEGVTFTPWSDGYAVGFRVTAEGMPTRYVYLNPSSATDTEDIHDSDVFVYRDETGDSTMGQPECYVNIWDKED